MDISAADGPPSAPGWLHRVYMCAGACAELSAVMMQHSNSSVPKGRMTFILAYLHLGCGVVHQCGELVMRCDVSCTSISSISMEVGQQCEWYQRHTTKREQCEQYNNASGTVVQAVQQCKRHTLASDATKPSAPLAQAVHRSKRHAGASGTKKQAANWCMQYNKANGTMMRGRGDGGMQIWWATRATWAPA